MDQSHQSVAAARSVIESALRRRLVFAGMSGFAAAAFASPQIAVANAMGKSEVSPDGIVRTTLQSYQEPDGTEFTMMLVTFPPGAASPSHHHPAIGLNYIVSGVVDSQYEGEEMKRYVAGDSYQDKSGAAHKVFRNASADAPLVFLLCYRVKQGQAFRTIP
jgi:quercetin dioxygenase-like cupin family protein